MSAALPVSGDTAGRPDDPTPDETYEDVEGPAYPEDKGGGSPMAPMVAGALAVVNFPYVKYNWSIQSWYSTADGLRFYGAYYKGEQIFYDYRAPWVKVNGVKHALATLQLVEGPDLWVYNGGMFLVKARYNLGNPNVDVTVVTRFYEGGTMEPWVLVNGFTVLYNFVVAQRFDFDLGGWGDDNQQYYNGATWTYSTTEHDTADGSFGEDSSGYQWRDFDTDQSGGSYVTDQEVKVKPYHPDAATWYSLVYMAGQVNSDPVIYESGQTINTKNAGQPDPWVGYDAVNWYVSSYTQKTIAYPGPWVTVVV